MDLFQIMDIVIIGNIINALKMCAFKGILFEIFYLKQNVTFSFIYKM